jgi:hypothetical protein
MSLLAPLASGLLSRRAVNQMARMIPNPVLRFAVVLAASTIVPYLAARAAQHLADKPDQRPYPFPKSR